MSNSMNVITNPSHNFAASKSRYTQMQQGLIGAQNRRVGMAKYDRATRMSTPDGASQTLKTDVNDRSDMLTLVTDRQDRVTITESIRPTEGGGYEHCVHQEQQGRRRPGPFKFLSELGGEVTRGLGLADGPNCITHMPPGFE